MVHRRLLRLTYRPPLAAGALLAFLGVRAVPGVESYGGGTYRRTLRLPGGPAAIELSPDDGHIRCLLHLADPSDEAVAAQRCRRLLDLDADPVAVDGSLSRDPLLAPWIRRSPGRRVPGAVDGYELTVRAIVGQQVSVAGARTLAGRLVARFGERLPPEWSADGLTHLFPAPAAIAGADMSSAGMPGARVRALVELSRAVASGDLTIAASSDRESLERRLTAIRGIGQWTASYVAMRVLGDPDAFLPTDLGVRNALARLGQATDVRNVTALAAAWRPWRAYALQYLWSSLETTGSGPGPAAAAG